MEFLQAVLGDTLYKSVSEAVTNYNTTNAADAAKQIKLANLSTGEYVSQAKYKALETTNGTLTTEVANLKQGKTIDATLQANFDDMKGKYSTLQGQYATLQNTQIAIEKGVDPKFAKFVAAEAAALVSDALPIDKAIDGYLAKNAQFKLNIAPQPQQKVTKVGTAPTFGGGAVQPQANANTAMNNLLLEASGRYKNN